MVGMHFSSAYMPLSMAGMLLFQQWVCISMVGTHFNDGYVPLSMVGTCLFQWWVRISMATTHLFQWCNNNARAFSKCSSFCMSSQPSTYPMMHLRYAWHFSFLFSPSAFTRFCQLSKGHNHAHGHDHNAHGHHHHHHSNSHHGHHHSH